jgi:hypothetical protein
MKNLFFILFAFSMIGCGTRDKSPTGSFDFEEKKGSINLVLDNWHTAAAEANFEDYFGLMSKDGVFLGTDATENWQNEEFRSFSKPYFDKGKAWSFTVLERNIYFSSEGDIAWFDELLDTQMGICRGSGVLEYMAEGWKIKHYVLSIAIPNENVSEVTQLKKEFDEALIEELTQ